MHLNPNWQGNFKMATAHLLSLLLSQRPTCREFPKAYWFCLTNLPLPHRAMSGSRSGHVRRSFVECAVPRRRWVHFTWLKIFWVKINEKYSKYNFCVAGPGLEFEISINGRGKTWVIWGLARARWHMKHAWLFLAPCLAPGVWSEMDSRSESMTDPKNDGCGQQSCIVIRIYLVHHSIKHRLFSWG